MGFDFRGFLRIYDFNGHIHWGAENARRTIKRHEMKTLNEAGHARLIKFLFENHKNAVPIVTYFLSSWIKDAEDHLRNDKHGYIELAASDSVCHRMRICNFDDTHFKDD